ncbi:hypothetical protein ACL8ED_29710 [Pseudomonas aeruginosa]|uniref:Uncharacterized protein n=1 Tax=Stutzerimonas frequens TaxID=2968969 RepID=A0AA47I0P6_9GAMM|nr:hypothetical protein [Stutzerimonas frequens]ELR2941272.1 hypothetical protein [Pseudomonas aeruginosa]ELR2942324.1 hypothetical protein [Pseudomonas aeruginosa]WAE53951.1 hypothetical protein OSV15_07160 [Stutzerimonas frequens]
MTAEVASYSCASGPASVAIYCNAAALRCNLMQAMSQNVSLAAEQVVNVMLLEIRPVDINHVFVETGINEVVVADGLPPGFVYNCLVFGTV